MKHEGSCIANFISTPEDDAVVTSAEVKAGVLTNSQKLVSGCTRKTAFSNNTTGNRDQRNNF